jgi:hypothetical protein
VKQEQALHEEAQFLLAQQHQLNAAGVQLGAMSLTLDQLLAGQHSNDALLEQLLAQAEAMASDQDVPVDIVEIDIDVLLDVSAPNQASTIRPLDLVDLVQIPDGGGWRDYLLAVDAYGERNKIRFTDDPFRRLMGDSQRMALEKRIKDEFSLKGANCDKYDYMIAATCGLIGGLVDIFFVGLPGDGPLGRLTDEATATLVEKFAGLVGWPGAKNPANSTASAIGFLERKFPVNYDHRHSADVGGAFKMSSKNHHVKSLAHSPDLIGLFFSLLNQFTNTATFISEGKLITIDTATFELQGTSLISKLFSGFANWLGHLFSDMAASSGTSSSGGRGTGIPVPFYSLLLMLEVGEFGQHRQTFATVAVRVFEQGYDLRHGFALSIPLLTTELLTRLMWSVKQAFFHDRPLPDCVPSAANPELRRMLMVAHGSLCMVDAADAGIRSGGDIVQFMLRSNLIAWARFGTLALREMNAWYAEGSLDIDAVDDYLDAEYRRMAA